MATVWQIAKLTHASSAVSSLPDLLIIMLGLGFELWSAGNQQRELTTSPMTFIVEQAKGNTVFDMFVVTLIIVNKFVEPAPR